MAEEAKDAELTDQEHAELLMLYQTAIEDIERSKQRQFKAVYAIVVAQGAVAVTFAISPTGNTLHVNPVKAFLALLTFMGLVVIWLEQRSLTRFRVLLKEVYRPRLKPQIRACLETSAAQEKWRWVYPVLMVTALFLAFFAMVPYVIIK